MYCGPLEDLRVDDVGDDRLVFAGQVLVEELDELLARELAGAVGAAARPSRSTALAACETAMTLSSVGTRVRSGVQDRCRRGPPRPTAASPRLAVMAAAPGRFHTPSGAVNGRSEMSARNTGGRVRVTPVYRLPGRRWLRGLNGRPVQWPHEGEAPRRTRPPGRVRQRSSPAQPRGVGPGVRPLAGRRPRPGRRSGGVPTDSGNTGKPATRTSRTRGPGS